jgi:hypothetical protein
MAKDGLAVALQVLADAQGFVRAPDCLLQPSTALLQRQGPQILGR